MRIEIERDSDDGLRREVWWFWLNELDLVLDQYFVSTRATLRHKFRLKSGQDHYSRITDQRTARLPEAAMPLPDDVISEARERLIAQLRVIRWSDRYGRRRT